MRADIEGNIEKVIVECGFERVNCSSGSDNNSETERDDGDDLNHKRDKKDRTKWNQTLRLYKQIDI